MSAALYRWAVSAVLVLVGMVVGWGLTLWTEGRPWGLSVAVYPQPEAVDGSVTGWRVDGDGTLLLWSTACGEGR